MKIEWNNEEMKQRICKLYKKQRLSQCISDIAGDDLKSYSLLRSAPLVTFEPSNCWDNPIRMICFTQCSKGEIKADIAIPNLNWGGFRAYYVNAAKAASLAFCILHLVPHLISQSALLEGWKSQFKQSKFCLTPGFTSCPIRVLLAYIRLNI